MRKLTIQEKTQCASEIAQAECIKRAVVSSSSIKKDDKKKTLDKINTELKESINRILGNDNEI